PTKCTLFPYTTLFRSSEQIMQRMAKENIGTDMIRQLPGRSPGLYIIRNTPDGERDFFYWRKEAPARELFSTEASAIQLTEKLRTDRKSTRLNSSHVKI